MARDYKYRAHPRKKKKTSAVPGWKWFLIVAIVGGFAFFLKSLRDIEPEKRQAVIEKPINKPAAPEKPKKAQAESKSAEEDEPQFDFYTILPEKEVVVPDYEIKTRKREESVGKAKETQYIMQAGSFRNYADADRMKARLAFMGIESRIEKAKIGNILWHRIKIGPFDKISSVDRIRTKLRQNQIDTVVTEIEK
ncbi:MAG: SPOR domain-containing protein [Gammaproteobacteria bacterium]